MEYSKTSLNDRLVDGVVFLLPVTFVLYVLVMSVRVIPGKWYSTITYFGLVTVFWGVFLKFLGDVCKIYRVRIALGLISITGFNFLIFKFTRCYTPEMISFIKVQAISTSVTSKSYNIILCLKSGREETIKEHLTLSEAFKFQYHVCRIFYGNDQFEV